MAVREDVCARDAPFNYYSGGRTKKHLSTLREHYRQANQQLFDVCCKLQERFDVQDLAQASVLVAELKALKAWEEEIKSLENWSL
jgi:hypothetical protein